MKLQVISDLHLSVRGMEHPRVDCDVVVLAGDIARPAEAISWAKGFDKPVIYVPGNHEFYGGCIEEVEDELRSLAAGSHVHVLAEEEVTIHGVRFLGATLWTDFELFGTEGPRSLAMSAAQKLLRDFSRIKSKADPNEPFTPRESAAVFKRHAAWIKNRLREKVGVPTVVVTHHAPSLQSVHPRFAGSILNASFVSNAEHLVEANPPRLWIHGHTHDSFNYWIGQTQVVCNPRGYAKSGENENAAFDAGLVLHVGQADRPDRYLKLTT